MINIKLYDKVRLKDNRIATIVEIYEQYKAYETDTIKYEDIKELIKENN